MAGLFAFFDCCDNCNQGLKAPKKFTKLQYEMFLVCYSKSNTYYQNKPAVTTKKIMFTNKIVKLLE